MAIDLKPRPIVVGPEPKIRVHAFRRGKRNLHVVGEGKCGVGHRAGLEVPVNRPNVPFNFATVPRPTTSVCPWPTTRALGLPSCTPTHYIRRLPH